MIQGNKATVLSFSGYFILGIWLLMLTLTPIQAQTFKNVAADHGIDVVNEDPYRYGGTVSFYDFTQNGWDDLTFAIDNDSVRFFVNEEGTFREIPSFIYADGKIQQLLWVDYNNNGHLDLFVTFFEGPYKLYENDGDFNFTDVSEEAGLTPYVSRFWGASFGDYNRSGYLDLYICNYEFRYEAGDHSRTNQLYRNNGDGTFTNVTIEAGVGDSTQNTFQSVWLDYNNNGWPDLFVINDLGDNVNALYRNNGDGTFTNVAEEAGFALQVHNPMSISVGDFNNNGFADIYISNAGVNHTHGLLLVNNGDETFTESATEYGVDLMEWAWGTTWIDYNNNSYRDLFVATGWHGLVTSYFYENLEGESFREANHLFLDNLTATSMTVARGDFTNNGYYDLVVHNVAPDTAFLWENSGGDNNYIKLTPKGTISNSMAVGSKIEVFTDGKKFIEYTFCGENYMGQSSQHQIFGLGQSTIVDSVKVTYTSGHTDVYYNLNVNSHYYLTEGETMDIQLSQTGNPVICESDSIEFRILNESDWLYYWNTGDTGLTISVNETGYYFAIAQNKYKVENNSDTIWLEVASPPFLSRYINHPTCYDSTDGSISILSHPPQNEYSIQWSTGENELSITDLPEGSYGFKYTGYGGCIVNDTITLRTPPPIRVHKQVIPEMDGGDGKVNLLISGGTPPYRVFVNDILSDQDIEGLTSGDYALDILDANNCKYNTAFFMPDHVSLSNSHLSGVSLYPNPVTNQSVFLVFFEALGDVIVTIHDITGRQILEDVLFVPESGKYPFDLNAMGKGIYFVNVKSKHGQANQKLVVQ